MPVASQHVSQLVALHSPEQLAGQVLILDATNADLVRQLGLMREGLREIEGYARMASWEKDERLQSIAATVRRLVSA